MSGELYDLGYAEQRDGEKKAQMIREFNTLAVIFDLPSSLFVESSRLMVSKISSSSSSSSSFVTPSTLLSFFSSFSSLPFSVYFHFYFRF